MSLGAFIKQKSYEKIVFALRKHPITFAPVIILFIILLLMPPAIYFLLLKSMLADLLKNSAAYAWGVLLASIYYLSVVLFFYTYFVTFYLDLWIVTNDRLLDIQQKNIFSRTISEVDLYQIQDATSEVQGFFQTIFNFGNITLQTAGAVPRITFRNVKNPHALREAILDLSAEDKKYHSKP